MKRIISLGLVGILICSALVGCSEEVLQKYPLVLLLLLLPHHPNLPLVSLHLVVPLHPYPVQAHLVVSRLKILLLVQRVLRFLSPSSSEALPKALLLLLLRKSLSL